MILTQHHFSNYKELGLILDSSLYDCFKYLLSGDEIDFVMEKENL